MTAHPRSRGENPLPSSTRLVVAGSSPLTRGKLSVICVWEDSQRLIPAHAGKTHERDCADAGGRAHPRSRGENRGQRTIARHTRGSSPLTRGKPAVNTQIIFAVGLIPAHAGKTPPTSATCIQTKAHPRSRGENASPYVETPTGSGSSPLTRGKPLKYFAARSGSRLIPAHAGKTPVCAKGQRLRAAHPRSRGENGRSTRGEAICSGSSPLTRGKPERAGVERNDSRLIPAHAGKTCPLARVPQRGEAHPRSRGENGGLHYQGLEGGGSSPLTRGKQSVNIWHVVSSPAHPRSRGENTQSAFTCSSGRGSSPLTRGKRSRRCLRRPHAGLIPAHAGKTRR